MSLEGRAQGDYFAEIAAQLREGRTTEQTYQLVAEAAVDVIDGCDRAGIGILQPDGRFVTAAATDDVIVFIDKLQDELDEGPCFESSAEQVWKLDNDITVASQWPRLAPRVIESTPVRAMLAVPLVDQGRRSGALNVFADRAGAFTEESTTSAAILAAFASVASTAARETERADQLQEGLATNREIGAAIGILMATHQISNDEAFTILSTASQRLNRKMRDLAAGIVRGDASTTAHR